MQMPGSDRFFSTLGAPDELSLFCGGPFYKLQVSTHLIRVPRWDLPRRIACSLVVCWLPLIALTALLHREELLGLLKDYLVYSRVVIAIPVLLTGQLLMEERFRVVVRHVREAQLLSNGGKRELGNVISSLKRLRDSAFPELIILTLVVAELAVVGPGRISSGPAWAVSRTGIAVHPTAAGWYYLLASVSSYQFLLALSLWKWLVWSYFLYRLSRMDMTLVATHADLHGGLGFLGLAPIAFIPTAVAVSISIGGTWRYDILHQGTHLASYTLPAIMLVALIFMFELGPLCFFISKLSMLRQRAMLEYAVLSQTHATQFHDKWISGRADREETPFVLGVAMLADLATSYNNIEKMRPLPVDKITLISLALAVLIPLFPAVLAEIPLTVILKALFQAIRSAPI